MVDPLAEYSEVWLRRDDKFVCLGIFGPDEKFVSPVLNKQLVHVGSIFR